MGYFKITTGCRRLSLACRRRTLDDDDSDTTLGVSPVVVGVVEADASVCRKGKVAIFAT